ncbi:MAG: tRNA (adenosine(37)-N6)-threonylcarbamoyltransferase complex ATPase subunit type 1 TsaE [Candidatus Andersenbacteria bacterium]
MPRVEVPTVAATAALAQQVAATLPSGALLLLSGEMGTGKTVFTQSLAAALEIKEPVTSPTFTIVGEYAVPAHSTITTFVHVDLYRLSPEQAVSDPLVAELVALSQDPRRVTVIEWADKLGSPPAHGYKLQFAHATTGRVIDLPDKLLSSPTYG